MPSAGATHGNEGRIVCELWGGNTFSGICNFQYILLSVLNEMDYTSILRISSVERYNCVVG